MLQPQKSNQDLIIDIKNFLDLKKTSFKKFAYLAMTSKVENPIRDEIALFLHNKYNSQYYIGREWKRRDLAILDKQNLNPIVLIEFKNCYTLDFALGNFQNYVVNIDSDFSKAAKCSNQNTLIYEILIVTEIKTPIPRNISSLIKYSGHINKSISPSFISKYNFTNNTKFNSPAQIWQAQEQNFINSLNNLGIVRIYNGDIFQNISAYNINCSLFYHIFEKQKIATEPIYSGA